MGQKTGRKTHFVEAQQVGEYVADQIEWQTGMQALVAGSVRRGKEIVSDVDIVVSTELPSLEEFDGLLDLHWTEKSAVGDVDNVRIEVTLTSPECLGAAMLYRTGPGELNIAMRAKAKRQGRKLSEYGLFEGAVRLDDSRGYWQDDEENLFRLLGMPWIDPTGREHWRDALRGR